jgi:hypothetical protein
MVPSALDQRWHLVGRNRFTQHDVDDAAIQIEVCYATDTPWQGSIDDRNRVPVPRNRHSADRPLEPPFFSRDRDEKRQGVCRPIHDCTVCVASGRYSNASRVSAGATYAGAL